VAQAILPAATALLRSPGAGFWRQSFSFAEQKSPLILRITGVGKNKGRKDD
jgi:hypothetical protein